MDNLLNKAQLRELNEVWETDNLHWYEKEGRTSIKSSIQKGIPRPIYDVIDQLYSPMVRHAVGKATGIDNLVPDPYWHNGGVFGGGMHQIPQGGFLKMHVDFNLHPKGLYRRANLLLYVNEEWNSEWGGNLQLGELVTVEPLGGRAVLFGTTEDSWHGHPEPLETPDGVSRRSIAVYYYTKTAPPGLADPHTTVYRSK